MMRILTQSEKFAKELCSTECHTFERLGEMSRNCGCRPSDTLCHQAKFPFSSVTEALHFSINSPANSNKENPTYVADKMEDSEVSKLAVAPQDLPSALLCLLAVRWVNDAEST